MSSHSDGLARGNRREIMKRMLGACVLGWLAASWSVGAAWAQTDAATTAPDNVAAPARVGWVEVAGVIHEGRRPLPFMSEGPEPSLERIVGQLRTVAEDPTYKGAVVYLDAPVLDFAQVEAIGQAIRQARAAGRTVLVFAEVYSMPTYLLACSADQILLQRRGELMLTTIGMEEMYLAGLLEKIGVRADLLQVGRFKGAMEPWTRREPSADWSANIDALLDDVHDLMMTTIAAARGLSAPQVEAALAQVWTLDDQGYVRSGLVDMVVGRDMTEATSMAFGSRFVWDKSMGYGQAKSEVAMNPFALFQSLLSAGRQRVTRDTILLVRAVGPIHAGKSNASMSSPVAGPFVEASIGSRTLVKVLREAQRDPRIKGVVLRIESPGGSALASEIIWQALRAVGETKPLYVSVGSMAASGGYYLASAGQRVYVAESSLLGSIGVVGGKLVLGDLYEKLGLDIYRRSRGPLGDLFNSVEPFTDGQRQMVLTAMQRVYDTFLDRVREGRGQRVTDVETLAAGRLFTGRQAVANGLADQIGAVEQVIADLADEVGLQPGQYDVIEKPDPPSFAEVLDSLFGVRAAEATGVQHAALMNLIREVVGPRRWRAVAPVLGGLLLLQHEHSLTLMPAAVLLN